MNSLRKKNTGGGCQYAQPRNYELAGKEKRLIFEDRELKVRVIDEKRLEYWDENGSEGKAEYICHKSGDYEYIMGYGSTGAYTMLIIDSSTGQAVRIGFALNRVGQLTHELTLGREYGREPETAAELTEELADNTVRWYYGSGMSFVHRYGRETVRAEYGGGAGVELRLKAVKLKQDMYATIVEERQTAVCLLINFERVYAVGLEIGVELSAISIGLVGTFEEV